MNIKEKLYRFVDSRYYEVVTALIIIIGAPIVLTLIFRLL